MWRPMQIRCKRAYDPVSPDDGYRVLVDRLWPRGIKQASLAVNEWNKALAPSSALRKQFHHSPDQWDAFVAQYESELKGKMNAVDDLLSTSAGKVLTLVYASRDPQHNNAVVLKDFLERCSAR